jgi:uncharacterized membrane protein YeiB
MGFKSWEGEKPWSKYRRMGPVEQLQNAVAYGTADDAEKP